jgi:hypothetical protein
MLFPASPFLPQAALIEYNLGAVDAALNAVREAVASGMDWRELGRMVKEERRAGNPVAGLIDSLQLEGGRITLLLRCVPARRVCVFGGGECLCGRAPSHSWR